MVGLHGPVDGNASGQRAGLQADEGSFPPRLTRENSQAKLMLLASPDSPAFRINLNKAEDSAIRDWRRINMTTPPCGVEAASSRKSSRLQLTRIILWSCACFRTALSSASIGSASR